VKRGVKSRGLIAHARKERGNGEEGVLSLRANAERKKKR